MDAGHDESDGNIRALVTHLYIMICFGMMI